MKNLGYSLLFLALFWPSTGYARPLPHGGPGPAGKHCAAKLERLSPDAPDARIASIDCYETFSEAIYAATEGRVWLPTNEGIEAQMQVLGLELESLALSTPSGGPYLIGIDYIDSIYRGQSVSYYASAPCDAVAGWQVSAIPDPYNDEFSSSRAFSNCHRNIQFEHSNYGGATLTCTPDCIDYGALNDEISSRQWLY